MDMVAIIHHALHLLGAIICFCGASFSFYVPWVEGELRISNGVSQGIGIGLTRCFGVECDSARAASGKHLSRRHNSTLRRNENSTAAATAFPFAPTMLPSSPPQTTHSSQQKLVNHVYHSALSAVGHLKNMTDDEVKSQAGSAAGTLKSLYKQKLKAFLAPYRLAAAVAVVPLTCSLAVNLALVMLVTREIIFARRTIATKYRNFLLGIGSSLLVAAALLYMALTCGSLHDGHYADGIYFLFYAFLVGLICGVGSILLSEMPKMEYTIIPDASLMGHRLELNAVAHASAVHAHADDYPPLQ